MQMLYNSDSYIVVQFEMPVIDASPNAEAGAHPPLARGAYEIVDKFARKEIFIEGALAERFKAGVQSLVESGPSEEQLDEFIAGFTVTAQQPVVLH